jgi:hypothetical protein
MLPTLKIETLADGRQVLIETDPETGRAVVVDVLTGEITEPPKGFAMFDGQGNHLGVVEARSPGEAVDKFLGKTMPDTIPAKPLTILDLLKMAGALPPALSEEEQILRDIEAMRADDDEAPSIP